VLPHRYIDKLRHIYKETDRGIVSNVYRQLWTVYFSPTLRYMCNLFYSILQWGEGRSTIEYSGCGDGSVRLSLSHLTRDDTKLLMKLFVIYTSLYNGTGLYTTAR